MQYCKSVTLRMRDRRNGTKSLFLDFWPGYRNPETMELIRRRSLGMYIYANPISTQQKKYNEAILAKAEAIRCKVGKSSVSCPLKPSDSTPLKHSTMPP